MTTTQHINTTGLSHDAIQLAARDKLQEIVTQGKARTAATIQRIFTEIPQDAIVKAPALGFRVDGRETSPRLLMEATDKSWSLHSNALGQLAERVGVPVTYLQGLLETREPWAFDLLERTLADHAHNKTGRGGAPQRWLVRAVQGQARAVLSDVYRRLDSRPLLESFVKAVGQVGAIPSEGFGGELTVHVRAIVPEVYEVAPGEFGVFGLDWGNSDFGRGLYDIKKFFLRLVCLNGMMGSSALKQIHLGKRLDDNLAFSAKTLELDTKTMASATADIVKGALGPKTIESEIEAIKAATEKKISISSALAGLGNALSKTEAAAVKAAFEGADVVNLPPEPTAWRFSNALSWCAHQADPERRAEIQELAGLAVPGFNTTSKRRAA